VLVAIFYTFAAPHTFPSDCLPTPQGWLRGQDAGGGKNPSQFRWEGADDRAAADARRRPSEDDLESTMRSDDSKGAIMRIPAKRFTGKTDAERSTCPGVVPTRQKMSMCNYWANRFCCEVADRAMQVHGGVGYPAISRSNTSTAITGAIGSPRVRRKFSKVAGFLFGFMGPRRQATRPTVAWSRQSTKLFAAAVVKH
jgi:Acyl-CoA dehydrogenase, C-terminal domain